MAEELSTRLTNDASQFNQSMDQATDKVEKFQDATDDAKKSIDDLGKKGALSTRELLKEIGKLSGSEKNFTNYRRQLAQMTRDIQDLSINYANMTKEMQNSDIGKATLQRIQELTTEAAKYKDQILDAQQSIKNLASDTMWVDAFKQTIDVASGALQTFAAAGVLSADSQEKLVKVIAQVKAIETSAIGVKKVLEGLNKNSKILDAVRTVQKAALVKATNLETAALGKATIAQKALNAVAKANPYILLATAILGVATAIGVYVIATRDGTNATKDAAKAQESLNKALAEGRKEANESIAKLLVLRGEWKSLKDEASQTKWIQDNQDRFKELGLAINDVTDAEKAFNSMTANIIKAMALRAQAAKLTAEAEKQMEKALNKQAKIENRHYTTEAYNPNNQQWRDAGITAEDYTKTKSRGPQAGDVYILNEQGIAKMKKAAEKNGEEYMDAFTDGMQPGIDKINELLAEATKLEQGTPAQNGGNGQSAEAEAVAGSLEYEQKALEKLRSEFVKMKSTDAGFAEKKKQVEDQAKLVDALAKKYNTITTGGKTGGKSAAEQEQERLINLLKDEQREATRLSLILDGMTPDTEGYDEISNALKNQEDTISAIKDQITDKSKIVESELSILKDYKALLDKQTPSIKEGTDEWRNHYEEVVKVENKIKDLEGAIENYKKRIATPLEPLDIPVNPIIGKATTNEKLKVPVQYEFTDKAELFRTAQSAADKIQNLFDIGAISAEQAQALIDNVNKTLEDAHLTARVSVDIDDHSLTNAISEITAKFDEAGSTISNIVTPINDIYTAFKDLNDKLDEAENGWERFFVVFETGMQTLNAFSTLIEGIATVMEVLNAVKAAGILVQKAENEVTKESAEESKKSAIAKALEAIAGGSKSASEIPLVGWVLAAGAAIAIAAAIAGAFASIKGYSTGGMVTGPSTGDKILARLNGGEIVLNKQQQSKLWEEMNTTTPVAPNNYINFPSRVELVAHGTELRGVLNNLNKKNSMI